MTKEDYMCLPKERLAELLVERDRISSIPTVIHPEIFPQCWEPNGKCMNPFRDCINCPRTGSGYESFTTTITTSWDETRGTQEDNSQMEEGCSSEKRLD